MILSLSQNCCTRCPARHNQRRLPLYNPGKKAHNRIRNNDFQGGLSVYTQQDLDAIREQRRKRWIALCIPTVVMVAAIIVTLVY